MYIDKGLEEFLQKRKKVESSLLNYLAIRILVDIVLLEEQKLHFLKNLFLVRSSYHD